MDLSPRRSDPKVAAIHSRHSFTSVAFAIGVSCIVSGALFAASDVREVHSSSQDASSFMDGASAFASGAMQAFKEGSNTLTEAASLLSEQYATFIEVAGQKVTDLAEQKALETTAALENAAAQLKEQQAAFIAQLADQGAEMKQTAVQAAIKLGESLGEGPEVLRLAALAQLENWKVQATAVASQAAAQFVEGVAEGQAALTEAASQAAARLAERQASFGDAIKAMSTQLSEHQTAILNNAATKLAERQRAFVQAAGQAASQLAERQTEIKQTASVAAAQLVERLTESPTILREAAERLKEQHVTLQQVAKDASDQLTDWKAKATEIATEAAAHIAEGVADKRAALVEAATQAVAHLSEQQAVVRDAISSVGTQLSERRDLLVQGASQAAAQLTQFCIGCGQDALREATTHAMERLAEHEMLMRESAAHVAIELAKLHATLSPTAGHIAARLAELQRSLDNVEVDASCLVGANLSSAQQECSTPPEQERFQLALSYLLSLKSLAQRTGLEFPIAFVLLCLTILCMHSAVYTILRSGGEDVFSLSYDKFLWRVATWFVHRVFLGWALLLLSDSMAEAPFLIPIYDAMGFPTWGTLLCLWTQLWFFLPAAVILNTAVARGSSCCSSPESRRFYASLSREVHAAIVGCFVSDWFLFPTSLTFLAHHMLGLGIVYGVWSMVLEEATLLASAKETGSQGRSLTTINFWWVTGLSVASMEAASFFFNLYSVTSFGVILHLSWFACFTYSNVLSVMCVVAQHPWGTSLKVIWAARSLLNRITEYAQVTFPQIRIPSWLSSKTTSDSVSYLWKSFMISVICLARQNDMWCSVREKLPSSSVIAVGAGCMCLACACVRRLKDFERRQ